MHFHTIEKQMKNPIYMTVRLQRHTSISHDGGGYELKDTEAEKTKEASGTTVVHDFLNGKVKPLQYWYS